MKKKLALLPLLLSLIFLQGCAGGLIIIAGAAIAVNSDERSIETILADDNLSLEALDKVNELAINAQNIRINFITNNSYLLVIGQINSEAEKHMIEEKLKTITGFKGIYNQLRINKPIDFVQQSQDSWITAKTISLLATNEDINSLQIKVVTEDNEVFLIGYVSNRTADIATNIARDVEGVKQVNRVFQIIPEK